MTTTRCVQLKISKDLLIQINSIKDKGFLYIFRISFVIMCGNLMNLRDGIFEKEFLADFEILAKDPVKNVRMLVGQVLLKHLKKNGKN